MIVFSLIHNLHQIGIFPQGVLKNALMNICSQVLMNNIQDLLV